MRLLNLGHLLVITEADAKHCEFPPAYGLLSLWRDIGRRARVQPATAAPVDTWSKDLRDLDFPDLYGEGLVTRAEWDAIEEAGRQGLGRWLLPYHWSQRLVEDAAAKAGSPRGARCC